MGDWIRVASHLGKSIQEAQSVIPSMEFTMWRLYLEEEEYKTTKLDLYLAQIAAEVRRTVSKKNVSLKQLILKWTKTKVTKSTRAEAAKASKIKWFGFLGLNNDGSNT